MENPKIIDITRKKIIEEIKAKVPFFVPEWQPNEADPGFALARIFTEMYLSIIDKINIALLRHYLSFLETLDIKLLPPQPAKVPVVFVPVEGTLDEITVLPLAKVAGKDSKGEPVVFETEKTIVVTSSKLSSIFAVLPETDCIYKQNEMINGRKPTQIFIDENLQNHIFYIGDSNIFNIKEGKIVLSISGKGLNLLASDYVKWEYVPERKDNIEDRWEGSFTAIEESGKLVLVKGDNFPIKETEINGIKSRWIRCRLIGSKESVLFLEIENILISVEPSQTKPSKIRVPVKSVHGIGKTFCEKLYKMNIRFVDELMQFSPSELSKFLNCPFHRAENILEAAKKAFYDKTGVLSGEEIEELTGIIPDFIFVNDVPVQPQNFHPFGTKPRLYDTCYIGSEEVFSKKGYKVTLTFNLIPGSPSSSENTPQLSWEYWDGEGWISLGINENLISGNNKVINISELPEIKKTTVNGKESYWIRVRLIGGDYGKEYEIIEGEVKPGRYCAPRILNLRLGYDPTDEKQTPQNILIENNLQIKQPKGSFKPFEFISDKYPALYLCFNSPLKKGPYSIYVDIDRYYAYPENEDPPRIKWQYYSKDGWKNMNVVDETRGLTKSGTIMFYLEDKTIPLKLFNIENGYWIRGVIIETPWSLSELSHVRKIFSEVKSLDIPEFTMPFYLSISMKLKKYKMFKFYLTKTKGNSSQEFEKLPICEEIPLIIKDLVKEDIKKVPPVINGIYLNATIVVQIETIEDEILGSSSGQPNESFKTLKKPVINESLWINELNALSEVERNELKKNLDMIKEEYDEDGQLIGFWVRWIAVDSFINSTPLDRHYIIDRASGEVIFGNGVKGKIPPIGNNNIKISYKTGGGKRGNLPAREIKELQSAISFIDSIYNPVASSGGCDTEDIKALIKRGSNILRHRNRAVSAQDYYDLAFEASRSIARVKVIPKLDDRLKYQSGHITIVVVPYSDEAKPLATPALKEQVKTYIEERASNLAKVHVMDPAYIKVNVQVELTTKKIEMIPIIISEATKKIKKFLHPLSGGEEGTGWEFGTIPCLSDLYALVQKIEGVEYVSTISLILITEDSNTYIIYQDSFRYLLPEYSLIYPGDVDVKVNFIKKEHQYEFAKTKT